MSFLRNSWQFKTFNGLTNRSFKRLWPAAWFWYTCRWMEMTVLSWLVLELTDSPSQVAWVGVCRMTPMFLFGFLAGIIADRFPKKRVMIIIQLSNLLLSSLMLLLLSTGGIQPWHTFVYMFLSGTVWTIDFSTRRSYYSEIFDKESLTNAMSLDYMALTGSNVLGPLLGGTLISLVGFDGVYILVVVAYLMGLFLLLSVRSTTPNNNSELFHNMRYQLLDTLKGVRASSTIWAVLMITIPMNLFGFSYSQLVPVIARDGLGVGSTLYGILGSAVGLGSMIGTLIIASKEIHRHARLFSLGAVLMLAALFSFALSHVYVLSLFFLLVTGLGNSGFGSMQSTIVLRETPFEMRGRTMGVLALAIGAMPLGIWLAGQIAEVAGAQIALALLAGIGFFVINVVRWRFPILRNSPTMLGDVLQ